MAQSQNWRKQISLKVIKYRQKILHIIKLINRVESKTLSSQTAASYEITKLKKFQDQRTSALENQTRRSFIRSTLIIALLVTESVNTL